MGNYQKGVVLVRDIKNSRVTFSRFHRRSIFTVTAVISRRTHFVDHEWGKHAWDASGSDFRRERWWFAGFSDTLTERNFLESPKLLWKQKITWKTKNYFSHPKTWASDEKIVLKCSWQLTESSRVHVPRSAAHLSFGLTSFTLIRILCGKLLIKLINFGSKNNFVVADEILLSSLWLHVPVTARLPRSDYVEENFSCVIGKISIKTWFIVILKHFFHSDPLSGTECLPKPHKLHFTIHDSLISLGASECRKYFEQILTRKVSRREQTKVLP